MYRHPTNPIPPCAFGVTLYDTVTYPRIRQKLVCSCNVASPLHFKQAVLRVVFVVFALRSCWVLRVLEVPPPTTPHCVFQLSVLPDYETADLLR